MLGNYITLAVTFAIKNKHWLFEPVPVRTNPVTKEKNHNNRQLHVTM